MVNILYEDNHIIVAYKPKGILSQSNGSDFKDMLTLLKVYIKEKYNKPGNVYLGLVHRLDTNTSGVMVFAKTSKAAARLSEQVSKHVFVKKYIALVEGELSKEGTLNNKLSKDEKNKKAYVSNNGLDAALEYKVIDKKIINNQVCSVVDIKLLTGRFHQIRCQFAYIGHPLYGDTKYGSLNHIKYEEFPLDAYFLGFYHPTTKEWMEFDYNSL